MVLAVAALDPTSTNTSRHFPDLILPRAAADLFNAVDSDKFDAMVRCAQARWARFVEIALEPTDITQWRSALLGLDLLKTVGCKDKVMFIYDTKCISDSLIMDRIRRPTKHPASFCDKHFAGVLLGLFGDPTEDASLRIDHTPYGFKKSAGLLLAFDGRRPSALNKIVSMSKKSLQQLPHYRGSVFPFRMLYSNKEFTMGQQPEPLETVQCIMSKNYQLHTVGRKFIDLPGTNNTRGLNSVPLAMPDEFDIKVLYSYKQSILGGVSGIDKPDHNDADMSDMFAGEDEDTQPLNDAPEVDDAPSAINVAVQV
jgi:hypothetical protein